MASRSINDYQGIILGYYPLRGKIQICRTLCEYLKLPYKDLLFTPQTWQEFKITQNLNWNYYELPFLKNGSLVVTETFPICLYLIHLANRKDLLGNCIEDQVKVDMFVWEADLMTRILALFASFKDITLEEKYEIFAKFWEITLKPKVQQIQENCQGDHYVSSLTIVDFYIYDLYQLFKLINLESYMAEFTKITKTHHNLAKNPEISAYQNSPKAIKNVCPATMYQQWRAIANLEPNSPSSQ